MKPLDACAPMFRRIIVRAAGFTLVELLVGLLFLATVAALSAPRLWNSGSEARAARQQAIYGSVRAAAQITRASAQVHNQLGPTGTVNVDGTTISTIFGYPAATEAGIVAATGLDLNSDQITLVGGGTRAGSTISVALDGASDTCTVEYTAPTTADAVPEIRFVNSNGRGGTGC